MSPGYAVNVTMLLTEEQARLKWCPYTRVGEQASGAAENRPDGSFNCITSQCMAWRWHDDEDYGEPGDRRGYCGAFGKAG